MSKTNRIRMKKKEQEESCEGCGYYEEPVEFDEYSEYEGDYEE